MSQRRRVSVGQILDIEGASKERVEYWILILLIPLNGHRDFFKHGFSDDNIAYFLGLDRYIDDYTNDERKEMMRMLKKRMLTLDSLDAPPLPKILDRNIKKVMKLLKLNKVETDILVFAIFLKYYDLLDNASRTLNELSSEKLTMVLSVLLDL